MSYIIEEVDECPVFFNYDTKQETVEYWKLYSIYQKKRFIKVLYQMRETWFNVFKQIKFIRDNGSSLEDSNFFMNKVHKMFIIEHRNKTEFYNDEKMRLRKKNNYLSKKISKLKNSKQKI